MQSISSLIRQKTKEWVLLQLSDTDSERDYLESIQKQNRQIVPILHTCLIIESLLMVILESIYINQLEDFIRQISGLGIIIVLNLVGIIITIKSQFQQQSNLSFYLLFISSLYILIEFFILDSRFKSQFQRNSDNKNLVSNDLVNLFVFFNLVTFNQLSICYLKVKYFHKIFAITTSLILIMVRIDQNQFKNFGYAFMIFSIVAFSLIYFIQQRNSKEVFNDEYQKQQLFKMIEENSQSGILRLQIQFSDIKKHKSQPVDKRSIQDLLQVSDVYCNNQIKSILNQDKEIDIIDIIFQLELRELIFNFNPKQKGTDHEIDIQNNPPPHILEASHILEKSYQLDDVITSITQNTSILAFHTLRTPRANQMSSRDHVKNNINEINDDTVLQTQNVPKKSSHVREAIRFYTELDDPCGKIHLEIDVVKIKFKEQLNILVFLNDITLSKQATQLREINNYKDEMLAMIAHDLRTPLNNKIALIQMAIKQENQSKLQKFLEAALTNGHFLVNLINDILDFSQIQNQSFRIVSSRGSMQQFLSEIVNLFEITTKSKEIKLELSNIVENDEIQTDFVRLRQVIVNFVSNSIQFTPPKGFIKIKTEEIQLFRIDEIQNIGVPDQFILVQVIDSGHGMQEQVKNSLFHKFTTYDDLKGNNNRGIGLGLVVAKQLVQALGPNQQMSIHIDTYEGVGTNFSFLLFSDYTRQKDQTFSLLQVEEVLKEQSQQFEPMYLKQIKLMPKEADPIPIEINSYEMAEFYLNQDKTSTLKDRIMVPKSLSNVYVKSHQKISLESIKAPKQKKILVADDDNFNLMVMKEIFDQNFPNCDIEFAHDGKQALDIFKRDLETKSEIFDLVMLDNYMPFLTGVEVAEKIKNNISVNNFVQPVLVLCSADDPNQYQFNDQYNNFFDLIVQKPLEEDSILFIQDLLSQKQ